ncbi:MAG: hypothetical protein KBT34_03215 [Prevotella sp.]|nr:hypothetical protein [Candidatus Prevotella equi]
MTKEQFLTKENLVNILSGATYGNSSVQIKSPRKVYDKLKEEFGDKWDEMCREDVWAEVLLHGGKLAIYDLEDEDEEGNAPKIKVGIEDFGRAFEKWRDERPQDYADFCTENDDFYTGWNFLQYVQFGEIVYG